MRKFVLLLVFAALIYGGWKWYSSRQAATASNQAMPGTDAFPGQPATHPAATQAESTPTNATPSNDVPIPSEVKSAYDQAESLWKAAGENPPASAKAALMDKLYSQVLMGIYNKQGQKELELKLVEERLTPLGQTIFFTKSKYAEDETGLLAVHTVASGENPDAIARKYGMSRELLNRLRGRDANDSRLSAGENLKVVKLKDNGGFLLHIDKGDFYLDCFVGGDFAKRYPISHGTKETPTPVGHTHLTDRVLDPSWTHPVTHQVFPPGDPGNILGRIWMAFSPDGINQSGLGIHGYTGPNPKMQAMVSNGCIRLGNDSALELYQTLSHPDRSKTEIEIVE